ncbi:putative calcium transporting ATPase, partial [Lipomyces arxii]|uniref:putative calcium transporting ATPase n=1 Tax=Lipomyces arxii TaxID=56418 RepID=UPI0034CD95AE
SKEHHHHHCHNASAPPHTVSPAVIAAMLQTDMESGLSESTAASRLLTDGKNVLESEGGVSLFGILLRQVSNSLTLVLVLA